MLTADGSELKHISTGIHPMHISHFKQIVQLCMEFSAPVAMMPFTCGLDIAVTNKLYKVATAL